MKYEKAKRNRTNADVYNENDPMFGGYMPEFYKDKDVRNNVSLHPEIRKMMFSDLSEGPDHRFNLKSREDAYFYEAYRESAINYYKAKQQFFDDAFENQLTLTTKEFMEKQEQLRLEDERMSKKLDFMYSYLDFDTDRSMVRTKFLQEMNKKTTLKDIGEILDKLVLDSKAENH
jgi:hypothetical protein